MLYGARYCSECLIRPFSKARLFLRQFALPIFMSFLSSLPQVDPQEDPADPLLAWPSKFPSDIVPSSQVPTKPRLCKRFPQTAPSVRPHSWFPGLNLTWARTNLGSQLTCMVGLSFLLQVILGRDFNEITFLSLSSRFFSSLFLTPISSPISPIYSSKLVVGS